MKLKDYFDAFSSGYDMKTALEAGLTRDPISKHMGSLDPRTGMVLKGRLHESWNPMLQTEYSLGNTVMYDPNIKRFFSIQGGMYSSATQDETKAHSNIDNLIRDFEISKILP